MRHAMKLATEYFGWLVIAARVSRSGCPRTLAPWFPMCRDSRCWFSEARSGLFTGLLE
ncbi:hypothetical protein [Bacteroides bouchesdurhonensis]|uniref:hypothetical protein n=1 Tax=Bacteroides bouchesdurhonensis TaxID=1841855 RepID=UPI001F45B1FC|nr:hypothetical protein [Bacteroides bouchesdurhonensis]